MNREEKLMEVIKENIKGGVRPGKTIMQGVVTEAQEHSCSVRLTENDLEIDQVLYSATDNENPKGFILTPKVGTNVLLSTIGGDENSLYLIGMDEIQSVKVKIESQEFRIDKDGVNMTNGNHNISLKTEGNKFIVKNGNIDLQTLLNDIVDFIVNLKTTTVVPPNTSPTNLETFTDTENVAPTLRDNIKKLFKN